MEIERKEPGEYLEGLKFEISIYLQIIRISSLDEEKKRTKERGGRRINKEEIKRETNRNQIKSNQNN